MRRRIGLGWRRIGLRRRRCHAAAALGIERASAAFDDDLLQPAIEPGQRLGNVVRCAIIPRSLVARPLVASAVVARRIGYAFDLARKFIKTFMYGGEVLARAVIIVFIIAAYGSAFVAHALNRLSE